MKLVRESLTDMPDSDKELIKRAKSIQRYDTRWEEVSKMEDDAITDEAKELLHSITMIMYHREEGRNI